MLTSKKIEINLDNLIETIQATKNCPWTKSLKIKDITNLIDIEVDELSDAIEMNDTNNIIEELGDIFWNMCLIVMISKNEGHNISYHNIFDHVINKMKSRYTWISFKDKPASELANSIEDVEKIWNRHHNNKYGKKERLKRDLKILNNKKDSVARKRKRSEEKLGKIIIKIFETQENLKVETSSDVIKKNSRCYVFCSDSNKYSKNILDEVQKLGKLLSQNKIDCINNGKINGCVDKLNRSIYDSKGISIGIIHEKFNNFNYPLISERIIAIGPDLNDAKRKIKDLSDGFIALPGGIETISEIWDIISDITIELLQKPIIIVNINGYYNNIINQVNQEIKNNNIKYKFFNRKSNNCLIFFVSNVNEAINIFNNYIKKKLNFNNKNIIFILMSNAKNIDLDENIKYNNFSAKEFRDNGIKIDFFYKIKLIDNANELFKGDSIKIDQKYFIIGNIKYNKKKNPISYSIYGSEKDYVKNIPWNYKCIKKVIGEYCTKN